MGNSYLRTAGRISKLEQKPGFFKSRTTLTLVSPYDLTNTEIAYNGSTGLRIGDIVEALCPGTDYNNTQLKTATIITRLIDDGKSNFSYAETYTTEKNYVGPKPWVKPSEKKL